ncbi:hypothetical protein P9112_008983 [Eukaryota sp. TZLM1-RC]
MSDTNQLRPSIRIGSSQAQRRIPEEETGPSSSPLTADQAPMSTSSVEATALSEDFSLPEGSALPENNSLPLDSAPIEGRDNPPKDSAPLEGRSPSLVYYEDEDVDDSVAPSSSSQPMESEIAPSPLPERSSEVQPSHSAKGRETVQPPQVTNKGTGVQPPSSQKDTEVPSSSPYP